MTSIHVMRTSLVAAFLVLAAWRPAAAQTGKIQVEVLEAEAQHKGVDACVGPWCNEQDFVAQVAYPPYLQWQSTAEIGNRDRPAWSFVASGDVSKLQRYHDIRVQLWDKDDPQWSADDLFDISPLAHHELIVHFDACNQTWEEIGLPTRHGPGRSYPPFGTFYSNQDHEFDGRVVLDVHTEGRIPFTTNDIAIVGIDPVQVAFDPGSVVSGKPTAMRVTIASTYTMPTPAPAPVTVTVTDGISTWTETRSVIIPQGLSTFYFFDGMATGSSAFYPIKPSYTDIAFLTYSVSLVYNDAAPAGTPPDFIDCYQYNNSLDNKQTPLVRTSAADPVFVRWDWLDSMNVPVLPALAQMVQRDEQYRETTWPLAQTNPVVSGATIGTFWNPTDLLTWVSEPYRSLAGLSVGAKLGGVDRMVLVTRKGWFQANHWRSWIWPSSSIGLSLGEFGPHAVIAEEGYYAVSTHELGHTYTLSRRKCSHDDMNAGCRDEYKISAADGAPFLARGLDVLGSIFPAGSPTGPDDAVTGCPNARPGTREVCRKNLMDIQTPGYFNNWTDTFTLNFLTDTLKNPADPELINLSGWVRTTNGWDASQAPIFEGSLDFSYHSFGVPDLEDPLAMTPPRPFSGLGPFSVRLTGDTGEHIYRFTPPFVSEGEIGPREGAYFSIFVPWDPTIFKVALYAPLDIRNAECEDRTCAEVLLFERFAASRPPIIQALAAGRDTTPSLEGPHPVPWIASGHDAVIAWSASDFPVGLAGGAVPDGASNPTPDAAGAEGLRAVLLLRRAGAAGGPGSAGAAEPWLPYAFENTGSEVRIPYALLADAPGDYAAQLIVSNGLQSSTLTSETLFHIVQGSGCQADPTPGAPCDDGDPCTGDDQCVQDPFAGVVCRGTPVNCDDNDACTVDSCNPTGVCVLPDNGEGTADLPPQGCGYSTLDEPLEIIDGLPLGSTIDMAAVLGGFTCPAASQVCSFALPSPGVDCVDPGGTLGGDKACAGSVLGLHLTGTGLLAGFNRTLNIASELEIHAAPRTPGDPVQSFDVDIFRLCAQLPFGDPDFDLLRIVGGDDINLPGPGHTILTRQASGDWDVDGFFDFTYRIDFIGKPGGTLSGMSGSTTGTKRIRTGGGACTHAPVACDDGNPCTVDSCDPATGACRFVPTPGAPCNDGDACTQDDQCVQGPTGGIACQGAAVDCDDGDPCTTDSCDPNGGACLHVPRGCGDGNACTSDFCDPSTGQCRNVPLSCDDGNACTVDACDPADGQCSHSSIGCDDQDACTIDSCLPSIGCVHQPVPPAGEPDLLRFDSQVTMTWSTSPGAVHWNTYRGSIPMGMLGSRATGSVYDQVCFESADAFGDGATVATAAANPPLGRAFFYLTSGEGTCGESVIGHASSGAVIPNTSACPTPP